jgi:KDO2-lipid IV(A) lauroyltransferase
MKLLVQYAVYLVVRIFICIAQALPIESCHSLARILAFVAGDVARIRRKVTDENLQSAFPEKSPREIRRLTRAMWEHLFLMVCEVAHAPRKLGHTTWSRYVHVVNKRELLRTLVERRPLVLVTGHYGNFEMAGYLTGVFGFSTFTVARPIDNPFLHRFINQYRSQRGQFILPKQGSAGDVQAVLDAGGILALLGDHHAGPTGCWVDFLGRPASCHKAIALLPLLHGAPMTVAYARRRGKPFQFQVEFREMIDPKRLDPALAGVTPITEWYNRLLEQLIRETPDQYWWLHRRWKGKPGRRRKKKKPAAAA